MFNPNKPSPGHKGCNSVTSDAFPCMPKIAKVILPFAAWAIYVGYCSGNIRRRNRGVAQGCPERNLSLVLGVPSRTEVM